MLSGCEASLRNWYDLSFAVNTGKALPANLLFFVSFFFFFCDFWLQISHLVLIFKRFKHLNATTSCHRPGVDNVQSTTGRIDCIILSAGHTLLNFFFKIRNFTSQIYQTFMVSYFFMIKSVTLCGFYITNVACG